MNARLLVLLVPSLVLVPACDPMQVRPLVCDGPGCDAGLDASMPADTGHDVGRDTNPGGCIAATVDSWRLELLDDVSVSYFARITPAVGTVPYDLYLTMERYGDVLYEGSFPLAGTIDDNRSTCAHCVAAYTGTNRASGFFVDRGTLELRRDPFGLVLDAALTNVRLVEVTIGGDTLMSTPVPGGRCIEIADTSVTQRFAPSGWTCAPERYGDGTCECTCGVMDADCDGVRPDDCPAGTLCHPRIEGDRFPVSCVPTCSRADARGCASGICALDFLGREYCDTALGLRSSVAVGGTCSAGATYCAPVGSAFFDGICDVYDRSDMQCRPTCTTDATCDRTMLERCFHVFGDTGLGFCSPRFPAAWTCAPGAYADGAGCDCGCGTHDPDCDIAGAPLFGCATGEICAPDDTCVRPPDNDTCATAAPLAVGTPGSPARTLGTTAGAANDTTFVRGAGGCLDVEEDGPDVVYSVDLAVGQTLTVVGTPDSDIALYLLGPGAPAVCDPATACVAGVEAAGFREVETLTYTATAAGRYALVVDSFTPARFGAFTLDASVSP